MTNASVGARSLARVATVERPTNVQNGPRARAHDPWVVGVLHLEVVMRFTDDEFRGRTVISADGKVIGTVSGLFITTTDWRIESIRIELRKDIADRIGANRSMFHRGTIEIPISFVQSVSDTVVLSLDVAKLREAHRPAELAEAPLPT